MTLGDTFVNVVPYIAFYSLIIFLFFFLVDRKLYSRPNRTFALGMFLILFGVAAKFIMASNKELMLSIVNLEPVIIFVDFSMLAIGGSFVASSFLVKSQIAHEEWKANLFKSREEKEKIISAHNKQLVKQRKRRKKMARMEYAKSVLAIIERIENLSDDIDDINKKLQTEGRI